MFISYAEKALSTMKLSQPFSAARSQSLRYIALNAPVALGRRTWRELPVISKCRQPRLRLAKRIGRITGNWGGDSQGDAKVTSGAGQAMPKESDGPQDGKLLSAMGLIMGTAVGPGILGLPSATCQAGLQASTVMIVGAWAYVTASILLVAELGCAVMAEERQREVSFTGLVSHTLGYKGACVVALVYASLNYALLVACISGLGSILHAWLQLLLLPESLLSAAISAVVGGMVAFAPFEITDAVNRALCGLMIAALSSLVVLGVTAGKKLWWATNQISIDTLASFSSVLSALPIIVLTLGFHVITPVVCRVVGGKPEEARKAILMGGSIPLSMVLVWNAVILGLAPPNATSVDPIQLLLSLCKSAAPAVQAFAFAALGTTLIGYALSFPQQLGDFLQLFLQENHIQVEKTGKAVNGGAQYLGALVWALGPPTAVAAFWPKAFASALDFAGIYANCFLFGVLPPIMAWTYRYRHTKKKNSPTTNTAPLLPGGKVPLLVLFGISVFLGIRPGLG